MQWQATPEVRNTGEAGTNPTLPRMPYATSTVPRTVLFFRRCARSRSSAHLLDNHLNVRIKGPFADFLPGPRQSWPAVWHGGLFFGDRLLHDLEDLFGCFPASLRSMAFGGLFHGRGFIATVESEDGELIDGRAGDCGLPAAAADPRPAA